jgi:hypothetical protein
MSNYADRLLRKGGIRQSDQEQQDTLDKLVRLFNYLTDKDMYSGAFFVCPRAAGVCRRR